jgi:hypothetical protein
MTPFDQLLRPLVEHEVAFIVVGGVAAIAHGSARLTEDVDVVYQRSPENLNRLVSALAPYKPYLRGAPRGLPFVWDSTTLKRGLNFTLTTTLGDLGVLGEIAGGRHFRGSSAPNHRAGDLRIPLPLLECSAAHPSQTRRRPPERLRSNRRAGSDRRREPRLTELHARPAILVRKAVSLRT